LPLVQISRQFLQGKITDLNVEVLQQIAIFIASLLSVAVCVGFPAYLPRVLSHFFMYFSRNLNYANEDDLLDRHLEI
jgi:hypothetical protein